MIVAKTITFKVRGPYALFSDPLAKNSRRQFGCTSGFGGGSAKRRGRVRCGRPVRRDRLLLQRARMRRCRERSDRTTSGSRHKCIGTTLSLFICRSGFELFLRVPLKPGCSIFVSSLNKTGHVAFRRDAWIEIGQSQPFRGLRLAVMRSIFTMKNFNPRGSRPALVRNPSPRLLFQSTQPSRVVTMVARHGS